jgi:hypothetical protein
VIATEVRMTSERIGIVTGDGGAVRPREPANRSPFMAGALS